MNSSGKKGERQREHRRQLLLSGGNQAGKPFAPAGIGDLIVVLDEPNELLSWPVLRRAAIMAPAIARIFPVENESLASGFRQISQGAEIHEKAFALAGKQSVERVVKIVVPLRVERVPSRITRVDDTNIFEVALGNQPGLALQPPRLILE